MSFPSKNRGISIFTILGMSKDKLIGKFFKTFASTQFFQRVFIDPIEAHNLIGKIERENLSRDGNVP